MKVSLVVAQGVHAGRQIPIVGTQFVIGRDPDCQLRPASAAISKKHCAIHLRGQQVFVKDFGSTNGTFVNNSKVDGEVEAKDGDHMKAGPLEFTLSIQVVAAPPTANPKSAAADEDDSMAAMLLEDDGGPAPPGATAELIPEGSTTIMDLKTLQAEQAKKEEKKDNKIGDTSAAAADILKQYQKRPRK